MEDKNNSSDGISEQEKKELQEGEKKIDEIKQKNHEAFLNVKSKATRFLKISDIADEDYKWFMGLCKDYADNRPYEAIKILRLVWERTDITPVINSLIEQNKELMSRIIAIEAQLAPEEPKGFVRPKTQGGNRK